jgi:sigma54-dependent transcription regulator
VGFEGFSTLYDFARGYPFDADAKTIVHITTGTPLGRSGFADRSA